MIRPEDALLLWCVIKCPDTEKTEQIRSLIRKGIDWSYLTQATARHGLLPLLYKHFESNHTEEMPKDVFHQLRDHFRRNTLWNLLRTRELLRLLDLFAAKGVQAIPYKGPILAHLAYGDLSLRQFDDIDIFVLKQDVRRVGQLLSAEGYDADSFPTEKQKNAFLRSKQQYGFYNKKNRIFIEIHWGITSSCYSLFMDSEDLFGRLQPVSLYGREIKTFSPEDLLLILCIHGSKHAWQRLAWICDVANLIEVYEEMDWERILRQACQMKMKRIVSLGLFLARDMVRIRLPETIIREFEDNCKVKKLATKVYKALFDDVQSSGRDLEKHLIHLGMMECLGDKVRYCSMLGLNPNGGDWQCISFPDPVFPFYYLIRPFHLALKYGPELLKRVFSG